MGILFFIILILFFVFVVKFAKREIRNDRESLKEYQRQKAAKDEAELLAKTEELMRINELRTELRYQATLVGDSETLSALDEGCMDLKYPEKRGDGAYLSMYDQLRIFKIAGINRRGDLSGYEGDFNGVLVAEPTNEYDPLAIMVKCDDGRHLGYIQEQQTDMVRSLMKAGDNFPPYRITGRVYKIKDPDDHTFYDGVVYVLRKQ